MLEKFSSALKITQYVAKKFIEAWLLVSGTGVAIFFWSLYNNKQAIIEVCHMLMIDKGFSILRSELFWAYLVLCLFYAVLLFGNAYFTKRKADKFYLDLTGVRGGLHEQDNFKDN